ncbi:hypothetical protein, conserved [Eimeria tenella]|uniref:Uncharacterized protein n=1 Tax=Eimeria tenella TaxID=5802 RepID=U6KQU8_EIMTE|nr:hypothetical protein, conserved [Eimeria tenella]CDJ38744.1 hypothetical protein, conserved [Eimeria tenella]|eukprot:XP_013229500.1 hypothetical protein, conserved [Eimeria tenella]
MPRHHAGPRDGASGPRCCPPSGSSLRVLPQQEEPSDDTEAPTLKWLRRSNRTDLRRFGVVTHTRKVNGLEYPFPPRAPKPIREGPSAFKPAAAEPWAAPQNYWGHTPRLGLVGGLGESGERRDSSSIASNSSSSRSSSSSSSSVESSEVRPEEWLACCGGARVQIELLFKSRNTEKKRQCLMQLLRQPI